MKQNISLKDIAIAIWVLGNQPHLQRLQHPTATLSLFADFHFSFPQGKSIGKLAGKIASCSGKSPPPSSSHLSGLKSLAYAAAITHACSSSCVSGPENSHMHHLFACWRTWDLVIGSRQEVARRYLLKDQQFSLNDGNGDCQDCSY